MASPAPEGFADAPWYVRVGVWVAVNVAFPVVLLGALLMFVLGVWTGKIPSPLLASHELAQGMSRDLQLHHQAQGDVLLQQHEQLRLLRAICRNTAATPADRIECDRGAR